MIAIDWIKVMGIVKGRSTAEEWERYCEEHPDFIRYYNELLRDREDEEGWILKWEVSFSYLNIILNNMDFYEMENRLSLCGVYRFFDRSNSMDELPVDKKQGLEKEVNGSGRRPNGSGSFISR